MYAFKLFKLTPWYVIIKCSGINTQFVAFKIHFKHYQIVSLDNITKLVRKSHTSYSHHAALQRKLDKKILHDLEHKLSIKSWEDWYKVTRKKFFEVGGQKITKNYRNSLTATLTTLMPEHPWLVWKFDFVPRGFWQLLSNQRKFLDWLQKELKITHWEQWYNVSTDVRSPYLSITHIFRHLQNMEDLH